VNVNESNALGFTALFGAVVNGHMAIVEILIQHVDLDVGVKNRWGETARDWALRNGKQEMTALLQARR
jgi:ankyrin repeat protein